MKMRFKLILTLLIAASGLAVVPQAVEAFHELKSMTEYLTQMNVAANAPAVLAHEKESAERALFVLCDAPVLERRAAGDEEFRWNGRVAPGRTIEIKGVNGDVRAEPSTGSEVEVVANKHGRRSNPSEVQIKVIEHEGGVTICAVYPSPDSSRPNECTVGENWSSHTRNNDVQVDFTVRVPVGLSLSARTVNGDVETGALQGDVEAFTVNGGINISARGYAVAQTVNGSIAASMGSADWPCALEFETVNGGITLSLPAATNAHVNAETVNGDISTDFPITVEGRFSRHRMSGTIGDGKYQLKLKTVNGSIKMQRGQ
jgi:hypothetical protein